MKLLLLPLLAVLLLLGQHSVFSIEEECRECICANTYGSPGNAEDCRMRDYGDCFLYKYCGPYDMSEVYWIDGGSLGNDFFSCMADWACANQTMDNYLARYCTVDFVGHDPPCSCEEQTRIHHCGPLAIHTEHCDKAWLVYETCLSH